jgi:hypothetical protein
VKLDYVSIEERGGIAIVRFDRKASMPLTRSSSSN